MGIANSKDKDGHTLPERARTETEVYPARPGDEAPRFRKVKQLDVDGILARSFKDVRSITLAVEQQSLEQSPGDSH